MSKSKTLGRSKHPHRSAIPNDVAREMILSGQGKGGFMKDRRERRPHDTRWKREAMEGAPSERGFTANNRGFTLYELISAIATLGLLCLIVVVVAHFLIKCW